MNGIQELIFSIRAGYSFFYVNTEELSRTIMNIKEALTVYDDRLPIKTWDLEKDADPGVVMEELDDENTPLRTTYIAKNWHWFWLDEYNQPDKRMMSILLNRFPMWGLKDYRKNLIIVGQESYDKAIPEPIRKGFLPISVELPTAEEIADVYEKVVYSAEGQEGFVKPTKEARFDLIQAAKGMPLQEVENAYAYSLVKTKGTLDPIIVSERKAVDVEKTAGIKVGKYVNRIEDLQGFDNVMNFVANTLPNPMAKGIMLLGPPGTAKTTFARAMGSVFGRLVLECEAAEMFGGLVGDTERLVREVLGILTANAPCIAFWDEIEKCLAGSSSSSSGSTDGGTTKRAMSQLLKFLSDNRPPGVYVIATCNDITSLDPEWYRPGRWDSAPFYVGLPKQKIQIQIADHYCAQYEVEWDDSIDISGWSGAEIEQCIKLVDQWANPITVKETAELERASDNMWANLPPYYQWLKDWEYV
jgi:ATP-dependent 26S proteasome regulatory subunit